MHKLIPSLLSLCCVIFYQEASPSLSNKFENFLQWCQSVVVFLKLYCGCLSLDSSSPSIGICRWCCSCCWPFGIIIIIIVCVAYRSPEQPSTGISCLLYSSPPGLDDKERGCRIIVLRALIINSRDCRNNSDIEGKTNLPGRTINNLLLTHPHSSSTKQEAGTWMRWEFDGVWSALGIPR